VNNGAFNPSHTITSHTTKQNPGKSIHDLSLKKLSLHSPTLLEGNVHIMKKFFLHIINVIFADQAIITTTVIILFLFSSKYLVD